MAFFRLLLAIFLITGSKASSSSEELIVEKPFITHIKFTPLPSNLYDATVRLYLPGQNFLEFNLKKKTILLKLENPIDPSQKEIAYYAGPPYTFLEPKEQGIEMKENGLLRGAAHSFHIPGEGGPFEKDANGRLWPSGFPFTKMTSTLELTLIYDPSRGGAFNIESSFVQGE